MTSPSTARGGYRDPFRGKSRVRASTALLLMLALVGGTTQRLAYAADGAVILVYHHVAAETPRSTSVTPERFSAHLDYLQRHDFTVSPLLDVLESIRAGEELAAKTVVLTFDDGYVSVLENAAPLLRERGWPFTVFVSSDYVDQGYGGYLTWDQLRQLAGDGATVGNHTRTHAHLVRHQTDESAAEWQQRVRGEITAAGQRIADELGDAAIPVLAYPYGEYDVSVKEVARDLSLFAVGQHSGAIGSQSDLLAAPRYPVATGYDELEDFELRVNSRALPAQLVGSERHLVGAEETQPALTLRLADGDYRAGELACYASNQGLMNLSSASDNRQEIVIQPRQPLRAGRTKYNCTAPATSEPGIYYWYSFLCIKRNDDGSWYAD
jgi:biofilm PGA synthesis lipoprotein PgaB